MAGRSAAQSRPSGKPCWVWFIHGLGQRSAWEPGFDATPAPGSGLIQVSHPAYVPRNLPAWRVAYLQPADRYRNPAAPHHPPSLFDANR